MSSLRVSAAPLIANSLVVGDSGHGVEGSNIPITGTDGPSLLAQYVTLPEDGNVEFRALLTTLPATGTLFVYEDGAFDFIPNGSDNESFTYEWFRDGVSQGIDTVDIQTNVGVTPSPTPNAAPIANAGTNQTVDINTLVQLDGSSSSDPDLDPITYAWTLQSTPGGSSSTLTGPTTVNPTITPDIAGDYMIQLIVNDGTVNSAADSVVITANSTTPTPTPSASDTTLTGQGIPDGTYTVDFVYGTVGSRLTFQRQVAFTNNTAQVDLSVMGSGVTFTWAASNPTHLWGKNGEVSE